MHADRYGRIAQGCDALKRRGSAVRMRSRPVSQRRNAWTQRAGHRWVHTPTPGDVRSTGPAARNTRAACVAYAARSQGLPGSPGEQYWRILVPVSCPSETRMSYRDSPTAGSRSNLLWRPNSGVIPEVLAFERHESTETDLERLSLRAVAKRNPSLVFFARCSLHRTGEWHGLLVCSKLCMRAYRAIRIISLELF